MKALKLALVSVLIFVIIGCSGAYHWKNISVKITLKNGTVIECQDGIEMSIFGNTRTACYKKSGLEYIIDEQIAEIVILRK